MQKVKSFTLAKLYYDLLPNGIVFYTQEQWLAKSVTTRNFISTVENAIGAYIDGMDRKNEHYPTAKREYKVAIRAIQGIEDDTERLIAYARLVNLLATKYGL